MRRHIVSLVVLLAACSRTFSAPQSPSLRVAGLALASGGVLGNDAPVPTGASVVINGVGLANVHGVLVGGAPATVSSTTAVALTFQVPALVDPSQQGQPQPVLVNVDQGQVTVGELRVFLAPTLTAISAGPGASGVVVGWQAYLDGTGFSSRPTENVVTVGSNPALPTTVLVASSTRLLVALPTPAQCPAAGCPISSQPFTVQMAPQGGDPALFAALNATRHAVIWKPIDPVLLVPPQAFAGDAVRLVAPQPHLYAGYDDPPFLSATSSQPTAYLPGADGGSLGVSSSSSSSSSGNPGKVTISDTSGGGFGTAVTADAGVVNTYNPYPADSSSSGGPLSISVSSSPVTHANPRIHVEVDAVDTNIVPWQRTTDGALLVTVPAAAAGSHSVAIGDPSGPSPSATLQILPGHVSTPSISCRAADTYLPGAGLVPRALRSGQVVGDVLAWAPAPGDPNTLNYAAIHSGGSLGIAWTMHYAGQPTVVSAGLRALFVSVAPASAGPASAYLHATTVDDPNTDVVSATAATSSAALEPDLDTPNPWILVAPKDSAAADVTASVWNADPSAGTAGYDLGPLVTDSSCQVQAAALEKVHRIADPSSGLERATLAYRCAGGYQVAVSQLLPSAPPSDGLSPSSPDSVAFADGGLLDDGGLLLALPVSTGSLGPLGPGVGVTVAQGVALFFGTGAVALDANAGASGTVEADAYTGMPFASDLLIGAAALSPDALQATVAGARLDSAEEVVRVYDRLGPTDGGNTAGWSLQGEFVLTESLPPTAIAYDASGSQVVVLFGDGLQAGYCALH